MPSRNVRAFRSPQQKTTSPGLLWAGALSFEERALASLERLCIENPGRPVTVLLFKYGTTVRPPREDRKRRSRNLENLDRLKEAGLLSSVEVADINPYSFRDIQMALAEAKRFSENAMLTVDISCLTKIHTVALASSELVLKWAGGWQVAYTVPENYGFALQGTASGTGWQDVLVLPLADKAHLEDERRSRGIVLAGHEGDRLMLALSELEPVGGVVVTAATPGRPDLRQESIRNNRRVLRWLTGRSPDNWEEKACDLFDIRRLSEIVATQVDRTGGAPLVLYPFGPKAFIFFCSMQLFSRLPERSWFVYPVPSSYDVDYSFGIGDTTWFSVP